MPSCAPTCEPSCGPVCAPNCYPGCDPCYAGGLFSTLDGAARAVVAPFHWLACAFTEGTYPDCGCAPRPPKTKCDPCTICGDYRGGCNDQCEYGAGSCAPCGGGAYPSTLGYQGVATGAYGQNVEYYDSEAYDSSPTRMSSNMAPRPAPQYGRTNMFAQLLAPVVSPNAVRPVSYERPMPTSPMPTPAPQIARAVTAPSAAPVLARPNQVQSLQNKDNVRIVAVVPEQSSSVSGKTFGSTRAVNSATQLR